MRRTHAGFWTTWPTSVCAIAAKDRARSRDKNFQVEPQRPSLAIAQIQAHHIIKFRPASPADLPQSGNTRLDVQNSASMPNFINFELVRKRRPWPDKRHFTPQNIPKLRQFVEAGFPQKSADFGYSGIVNYFINQPLGPIFFAAFFIAGDE